MDKRLVLAVAGSGKTRIIIEDLSLKSRTLIITYTNNNYENLKQRVIEKFGFIPEGISILTYFSFLYTFCYLPCIFPYVGSRSINYNQEHKSFPRKGVTARDLVYYQDYGGNVLANRLALMVSNIAYDAVSDRIKLFYDKLVIDEVQDFAANDFNLIKKFTDLDMNILYVGDFYQHTYDTSKDGSTAKNLFNKGYDYYKKAFGKSITIDDKTLVTSYRCSESVCEYVQENLGINIQSRNKKATRVEIVEDEDEVDALMMNDDIVKLFYDGHADYKCNSTNWGASKGIDRFKDVCVVLNKGTWSMAKKSDYSKINEKTKNKLYVAITRASNNVYFIEQTAIERYKVAL